MEPGPDAEVKPGFHVMLLPARAQSSPIRNGPNLNGS